MARTRKLEVVLAGDAKGAIGAIAATEQKAGGFGSKMATAGKVGAAAFAAVAGAAVGVGVGLFKVGASFDSAYDKIRVGTGATGQALKSLEGDFKAVVQSVPTDFESASTAIADLNTRLGLTGKPLQDISGQFLELSRITETDVAENIATATRVFGDFGIAAEEQGASLDALFRASQSTGIGVSELADKMTQFGAPLRQLGFDFNQSAALISKFEKEGVNTEAVLGGMKQSLGRMAKAGEEPIETFARLSEEIAKAGSTGEANAIAVEAFGSRAGPDLAAAVREGRFELGDLFDTIEGGSETIMQAGKDTQDFGEKWTMFKNRVLVALEPIAMKVFNALGKAMDILGPKVDMLVKKWGPPLKEFFQTVGETVSKVIGAISGWFKSNEGTISTWGEKLRSIFDSVKGIVVGFIDIVTALWDRFGSTILTFVQSVWPQIAKVIDGVLKVIKGIIDVFAGILTGDWSRVWEGIKSIFSGAWEAIKGILGAALAAIKGAISLAWDAVKGIFTSAWEGIKGLVLSGALYIVDKFLWLAEKVVGAAATAFGWVPGLGPKLKEARDRIGEFRDGVAVAMDGVKGSVTTAEGKVYSLIDSIDKLKSPAPIVVNVDTALADKAINDFFGRQNGRGIVARLSADASGIVARGDGPGGPMAPRGGNALSRVKSIIGAYPGLRVTSTYRSPARNRAAGGSPTSFHMDANNPAVDIDGPTAQLDRFAAALGGGWREKLWRVKGHFDHVHVAHEGGMVEPSWPTIAGLRSDERPGILQVGERVIAKGQGGGTVINVNVGTWLGNEAGIRDLARRITDVQRDRSVMSGRR